MYSELTEWLQAAERLCGAVLKGSIEGAQEDLLRMLDKPVPYKGLGGAFLDYLLDVVQNQASIVSGSLMDQSRASEDTIRNAVYALLAKLLMLREEVEACMRDKTAFSQQKDLPIRGLVR